MAPRLPFRVPVPNLGPRARKAARIAGYVALALFTFVLALQLTFPYDRVKAKLEEALAEKYQVTIGEVERGWMPGRVYFNSVSLQTRPEKPEDSPSTLYINRLEVDLDLLPFLRGAASVNLDAAIGAGHISGNLTVSKGRTEVSFEGSKLQAQMLPMREAIGLPMSGVLEFEFDLDLPNEKQKSGKTAPNWQQAEGRARIACPSGCTFGDGKTKLKTKLKNERSQAFAAEGIEFGKVTLKSLLAKVEIEKSQLKITQFEAPSDDGTLHVDYLMDLKPAFGDSAVTGCLRFNGSPALLQREPKTFSAITATGAPLGPDNLFHIRLTDTFKNMKRLGQPCGSGVSGKSMDDPGHGGRPTLSPKPDEPVKPAEASPPPAVPPPAAPPPAGDGAGSAPGPGSAPAGPPPTPEAPAGPAAAGSAGVAGPNGSPAGEQPAR